MKLIAIISTLIFALTHSSLEGYKLSGDSILFVFPSSDASIEIFVSGNFNSWSTDKEWQMEYAENDKTYKLIKPVNSVQKSGKSFYEFTFRVNGKLIDADQSAPNVIHCAGYGSRYLIHF